MKLLHAVLGVLLGVKRQCRTVFGVAVFVGKVGILFLNVPTVWQQDAAQITCARRAVDFALKAISCQEWQVAAVVQMGVRQNDGVDVFGWGRARVPIAQAQLFVALKQTAIDQQLFAVVLNAVFGTRDGVGTA